MSLNGDTYVMRNGRSTSEISVYNYPEHLNPFYEDDQHKRLRFWHISKKGGNENRRNSFSTALKDMWAFKSFRLKKKSSTLGINKTSESPPPLRRDFQYTSSPGNGLYTYDPRQRYTTNGSAPATLNGNFQRNAAYRSSLQNMNSSQGFGFNRNDQYRSTVQTTGARNMQHTLEVPGQSKRYVYAGSVTPQPLRNNGYRSAESGERMTRGISQNSVSSTNPFEDDDDDANDTISIGERSITSNSLSPQRPGHRKKRRAPPPPVPIHSPIKDGHNLSTESSRTSKPTNNNELHINEENLHAQENLDISNLTAEIESFVKAVNEGPPAPIHSTTISSNNTITTTTADERKAILPNDSVANGVVVIESEKVPPKAATRGQANGSVVVAAPRKFVEEHKLVAKETPTAASIQITKQTVEEKVMKKEAVSSPKVVSTESNIKETNIAPKSEERVVVTTQETIVKESTPKMPTRGILKKPAIEKKDSAEVGHLECIHVHIDRTETIPDSYSSRTSSFKGAAQPNTKPILKPKPEVNKLTNLSSSNRERKQQEQTSKANVEHRNGDILLGTTKVIETTTTMSPLRIEETPPNSPVKTSAATAIPTVAQTELRKSSNTQSPIKSEPESATASTSDASVAPLKIVESKEVVVRETVQTTKATSPASSPVAMRRSSNDEFKPILPRSSSQFEWKQSTLAPLEANIPPEKRKSVKDIIASINRSQRLLNAAAHKEPPQASLTILPDNPPQVEYNEFRVTDTPTTPLPLRKFSEPNNINRTHQFNVDNHRAPADRRSYNNCIDVAAACAAPPSYEESQKLDNAEILRKGQVNKQVYDYRESSPTTSNLDWNPVPKPKRTKNLQERI